MNPIDTYTASSAKTIFVPAAPVGSDAWMRAHGFHESTPEEMAKYGRFVKREGLFTSLFGAVRSWWRTRRGQSVSRT